MAEVGAAKVEAVWLDGAEVEGGVERGLMRLVELSERVVEGAEGLRRRRQRMELVHSMGARGGR